MAKLTANDLRNGTLFLYRDDPWVVTKYEHIKRGRGSATIKVKIRNIKNGSLVLQSFDQNKAFEDADVEKATGQFLYVDDKKAYFMHATDYEQYDVDKAAVANELKWLTEGGRVTMILFEEKLVGVEVAKSVVLRVIHADPAVKGDTSSGATKRVKLETGTEIDVPLFVKKGDKLKINTDSGTYVNRATE